MSKHDNPATKMVKVITLAQARVSLGIDDPKPVPPLNMTEDMPTGPLPRLRE